MAENFEPLRFFTAQEMLELLRRMNGDCTNYRIAKLLGTSPQTVLNVVNNNATLSDENCIPLAELLKLPPSYVILCMHLQRAKDDRLREAWQDMAAKYLKVSCFFLAGYLAHYLPFFPSLS